MSDRFAALRGHLARVPRFAWIGGAVLAVLGGVLFGAQRSLPGLVEQRLREEARARGLAVEIEGLGVGLGAVTFDAVRLTSEAPGVTVELDELSVKMDVRAWLRGSRRIDAVSAERVRASVTVPSGGTAAVLARLGGSGKPGGGGGSPESRGGGGSAGAAQPAAKERAPWPSVDIDALDLLLRDEAGDFVRLTGGRVRTEGDRTELSVEEVRLTGARESVLLERAQVTVLRSERVLEGAKVAQATLVSTKGGATEGASLLERAGGVVAELRRARPKSSAGAPDPGRRSPFHEQFALDVAAFQVVSRADDGAETVLLPPVKLTAAQREEGALELVGSGTLTAGGSVAWKLRVRPSELLAEGTVRFSKLPLSLFAAFLPSLPWHEPAASLLSGELDITARGATAAAFGGHVNVENLGLASERIAPTPVVGIRAGFEGTGTWDAAARRLVVDSGTFSLGAAKALVAGAFEWGSDHYLVDVNVSAPPTACGAAVGAIPAALLGELTGFSWTGTLGGRLALKLDSRALEQATLELDVDDRCQFVTVPALADLRRFRAPFEHRVMEPDGSEFVMETGPGTANWTPIDHIHPFLVHAVLAHEDAGFFGHRGFAVWAIEGALRRNLAAGRYVQGASTITMQLAKNVFLHREKTLARKVQEVLLTWWLESAMSKREMLELYLNVIEYGPSVYGIRNATRHYFGREPSDASLAEAAFLATILPSPKAFHAAVTEGLSAKLAQRVKQLAEHMFAKGRVDEAALTAARADLAAFSFHRAGAPPPTMHFGKGSATPLPFARESFEAGARAAEDAWETDDAPGSP